MSTLCIIIPDSIYYLIIAGSILSILSMIITIIGWSCPFLSNILQNRIINRHVGLTEYLTDHVAAKEKHFATS